MESNISLFWNLISRLDWSVQQLWVHSDAISTIWIIDLLEFIAQIIRAKIKSIEWSERNCIIKWTISMIFRIDILFFFYLTIDAWSTWFFWIDNILEKPYKMIKAELDNPIPKSTQSKPYLKNKLSFQTVNIAFFVPIYTQKVNNKRERIIFMW